MKKFHTTFEGFVQHKLHEKEQAIKEQGQFADAPPNENDAPWHYPHEDQETDDVVRVFAFDSYVDDIKMEITKTAIYGQLVGMYLGNLLLKYQDDMTRKDWEEILLYCEEKVFYSPSYKNIAEAFVEIESRLAANKLERGV